jgi:hypothetical protein
LYLVLHGHLQRDSACAAGLLDLDRPIRGVEIRGTADVQPDEKREEQ